MSRIFLGYPPPKIIQFIEEHYADPLKKPLTFTATGDSSVRLKKNLTTSAAFSLEYSYDEFKTDPIPYNIDETINLSDGQSVSMRAVSTNDTIGSSNSKYYYFVMSGSIAASGNIQSLLDKTCQRIDVPAHCYHYMFYDCKSLTTAPELPATTLAMCCYYGMFSGCSSLTQAPELPATTLASQCYQGMFSRCSALTQAPELPATTLVDSCYGNMFSRCSALAQAPELPATTLASQCYQGMFDGCKALTQAPELPATTLASNCYYGMFNNSGISEFTVDMTACTSVPSLPSSTLFSSSYKPYTVLVPASLYDEWITATNWSAIADKIQAA